MARLLIFAPPDYALAYFDTPPLPPCFDDIERAAADTFRFAFADSFSYAQLHAATPLMIDAEFCHFRCYYFADDAIHAACRYCYITIIINTIYTNI